MILQVIFFVTCTLCMINNSSTNIIYYKVDVAKGKSLNEEDREEGRV